VIVGFPQDEGVRRNHGRVGAARAPDEIRKCLHRLTAADAREEISLAEFPPLDAGNVRMVGSLENTQQALRADRGRDLEEWSCSVGDRRRPRNCLRAFLGLRRCSIGGGHHHIDAHLDVRPWLAGQVIVVRPFARLSKTPPASAGSHYVCIGAQPFATSRNTFAS